MLRSNCLLILRIITVELCHKSVCLFTNQCLYCQVSWQMQPSAKYYQLISRTISALSAYLKNNISSQHEGNLSKPIKEAQRGPQIYRLDSMHVCMCVCTCVSVRVLQPIGDRALRLLAADSHIQYRFSICCTRLYHSFTESKILKTLLTHYSEALLPCSSNYV